MLIPYVVLDGQMTVSDEQVKAVYRQLVDDGTINVVFYDEVMKSEDDFLTFMKNKDNIVVFPVRDKKLMGVAWLNNLTKNQAFAHFALFKEAALKKYTEEIGKEILDYWMNMPGNDGPLLDVLMGLIPEFNQKALYYIERLGFKRVGRIPKIVLRKGGKEAAILSYYEV